MGYSETFHLGGNNLLVFLAESLELGLLEVELAVVLLRQSVAFTKCKVTLASKTVDTNFLSTGVAFVLVFLNREVK